MEGLNKSSFVIPANAGIHFDLGGAGSRSKWTPAFAGVTTCSDVPYRGEIVGEYCCDFLIENLLIIELKALASTTTDHEAQVLNYLKATSTQVGLLLNFGGPRLGIKRLVLHHNDALPI